MTTPANIVRDALAEMSDLDFQRRVWAGHGQIDEVSSFEECVSHLFDDSGIVDDLDRNDPVFDAAVTPTCGPFSPSSSESTRWEIRRGHRRSVDERGASAGRVDLAPHRAG